MERANKVLVRLGFSDMVVTMEEAMDNNNEICSPNPYVVGYEDENGRECDDKGVYLNQPSVDPSQISIIDVIMEEELINETRL